MVSTDKRPNHERIIYAKLLRFKEQTLENYQPSMEYSASDYHHNQRPSRPQPFDFAPLGPSHRQPSQYSLLGHRPQTSRGPNSFHTPQRPSVAETEKSYDPFRPSRHAGTHPPPDHARVTVLRPHQPRRPSLLVNPLPTSVSEATEIIEPSPSMRDILNHDALSRRVSSTRTPSARRLSRGISSTRASSVRGLSSARRLSRGTSRNTIRSSSSHIFTHSYKRTVSFQHARRPSKLKSKEHSLSPFTLHQQYVLDGGGRVVGHSDEDVPSPPPNVETPRRLSHDARQVSHELAQLCDESWNRDSITTAQTYATPVTNSRSYDSPVTSYSHFSVPSPSVAEAPSKTSLCSIVTQEHDLTLTSNLSHDRRIDESVTETMTRREIERTRDLLRERARDSCMAPGYLDEVIAHLDSLMQPNRRAVSAPLPRKEAFPHRIQSEPARKSEQEAADIRPLTIRKKSQGEALEPIREEKHVVRPQKSIDIMEARKRTWFRRNVRDPSLRIPFTDVPRPPKSRFLKLFGAKSPPPLPSLPAVRDVETESSHSSETIGRPDGPFRETSSGSVVRHGTLHRTHPSLRQPNHRRSDSGSAPTLTATAPTPLPQNWLARMLRIKPAMHTFVFRVSKVKARKALLKLLRSWEPYGLCDVMVSRDTHNKSGDISIASRISGRLSGKNPFGLKAVAFVMEIHEVLFKGQRADMSVARLAQVKGAKSTFERVVTEIERSLGGHVKTNAEGIRSRTTQLGLLVVDERIRNEVRRGVGF